MKIKKQRLCMKLGTHGQGLVELALILPLLTLLLLGVVEVGFALYDYLTLATANREGVRLASRARFTDDAVTELVVSSSGLAEQPDGTFRPNMRLTGEDANLGVIIHRLSFDTDGTFLEASMVVSGTVVAQDGTSRPITPADTRFTQDRLLEVVENSFTTTSNINTYRAAMDYDEIPEELVILETFLAHSIFSSTIVPNVQSMTLYFHSTMRVVRDSRIDN